MLSTWKGHTLSLTVAADYTVSNWTDLNALIGPAATTDLTNKTVLVAGDCSGTAITVENRTWPGLVLKSSGSASKQLMPRLILKNVNGASGNPITFQYLDFYNVLGSLEALTTHGQITFDTVTSSYLTFDDCLLRDNDFSTKNITAGTIAEATDLRIYWGFGYASTGACNNLTITNCEIKNSHRSMLRGNNILCENNRWHDFYIHAATVQGNNITIRNERCWNLWAATADKGQPHAGVAFSPAPPAVAGDSSNIVIEGVVGIMGTARATSAFGGTPTASGIKFNDMYATGFRYRNCVVRGCLLVGNVTFMVEMDAGTDCIIEDNTFVCEAGTGVQPQMRINDSSNVILRNNISYGVSVGAQGLGSTKAFNNAYVKTDASASDSLISLANLFVGPSYSSIATIADALAAFALKPAHPTSSWTVPPGALANYNFTTGTHTGPQQAAPVSSNATARTQQLVTKPNNAWTRTAAAPTGTAAWQPANLRKFTFLVNVSNDVSKDSALSYVWFSSSSNRGYLSRQTTGTWRLTLKDSAGADILDAASTIKTFAADGVKAILVTCDLDQGKVQMAFSATGGAFLDIPTILTMRQANWDSIGRALTIGTDNLSTEPGNNFVGQFDAVLIEDQFTDLWTNVGLSRFFNTSGGLVDLGAAGGNPFGSTPAIFLSGNAAAWNGSSFNLGDGTGGTGGATATTFAKGGTGTFS